MLRPRNQPHIRPIASLPPLAATVGREAPVRLLGLSNVAAGFAANRLAESALLEELLLSRGEREALSAVPAGEFLVLGHFACPPEFLLDLHFC